MLNRASNSFSFVEGREGLGPEADCLRAKNADAGFLGLCSLGLELLGLELGEVEDGMEFEMETLR